MAAHHTLTHDDIIFRVLLQREEARPSLTFAALEASLPRDLRKRAEPDWRKYIRVEGLPFDSAFQKAIRKHLPGIYYIIMAAEFLAGLPFHVALSHFLLTRKIEWSQLACTEDDLFELADRLSEEIRCRGVAAHVPSTKPAAAPTRAAAKVKPNIYVKRCAFCKEWIPASELTKHVEAHISLPSRQPTSLSPALSPPVISLLPAPSPEHRRRPSNTSGNRLVVRFPAGTCIGCGHVPIPGDFYCYQCAPK